MARWITRHLRRPSTPGLALCGEKVYYYAPHMRFVSDVNCEKCLALIDSMHRKDKNDG